jgi:hypothetical protein
VCTVRATRSGDDAPGGDSRRNALAMGRRGGGGNCGRDRGDVIAGLLRGVT